MPDAISPPPSLLILCRDLLLGSKITAAAQSAGVSFKVIRDAGKLAGQVGRRLIVDLNQDGAIDAAAAWKSETGTWGTWSDSSRTSMPRPSSERGKPGSIR